jgi:hypothetical protein
MRDYSKFYTPTNIANQMIFLARPIRSDQYWLEPSAGDGRLIKALRTFDDRIQVHAIEINPSCKEELLNSGARAVFIGDFLQYQPDFLYDRIIANPPFGNGIDLGAHFLKMYNLCKIDGYIVVILPSDFIRPMEIIHSVKLVDMAIIDNWSANKDGSVTPITICKYQKVK